MIRRGILAVLLMEDNVEATKGMVIGRPTRVAANLLRNLHGAPTDDERAEWDALTKDERRALVDAAKADTLRGGA